MSTNLRRLGVYGDNLPVKRTLTVEPSDFAIGGIMGQFERKYNKAFLVNNIDEFKEIFGNHVVSTYYGSDAVKGFFDNVEGVEAKAYVAAYVGNDGTTIDAVAASRSVLDDGGEATLKAEAGYKENTEYGVSGNRTAIKITAADRFTTAASAACPATGQSYAELDSVVGIRVGDIILFKTNAGADLVYKEVTEIDENLKRVSWSGDFEVSGASGETLSEDDEVTIPGFRIQTYRKSINGVETEVETDLGRIICTMQASVSDFYAPNVHSENKWVVVTDESSVSTLGDRLISSDTDPVYLTSGANGTEPSGSSSWDITLSLFDNLPVRMLTNPEETAQAVHNSGEAYCKGRTDNPIWLTVLPEDQSKSQLITAGNNYQRSDEVDMVIVANWLKVGDPFSNSAIAPPRNIPNVGHVMGLWIRSIIRNGIHWVPAVKTNPIRGTVGVVGEQFKDDSDRTDIAEAGVNLIQELTGIGTVVRNFFTPSIDVAYQFANGVIMRNFIKVSAVDSLQSSENQPNSLNRIKADRMAVLQFLYRLWDSGSNGNAPTGETFGQTEDEEGNATQPTDHFEVKADIVNNPQPNINAGERNIDTYFTYPSPAGSIKIGVGILLL